MLDKGAKPGGTGKTFPLHLAATNGHAEVVKLLLDKGATVDLKDSKGNTTLAIAAEKGNLPIVQALLSRGADPNARNSNGFTPLMLASQPGSSPVVNTLLDQSGTLRSVKLKTETEEDEGNEESPQSQPVGGKAVDINAKNNENWTALMLAARGGHTSVARALVSRGAEINAKNQKGSTAVMWASFSGHTEIARILIDKGANITIKNKKGRNAMHFATIKTPRNCATAGESKQKISSIEGLEENVWRTSRTLILSLENVNRRWRLCGCAWSLLFRGAICHTPGEADSEE